ncbi:MAG: hypothetical protein KDA83_15790 [Planctomycetales bacterium]|nr:hypothetical protein [Planctomycetales bacterium]
MDDSSATVPNPDPRPSESKIAGGADPGITSVWNHLVYGLSLPERALRATTAMVGGALRESANLLVPQAFRSSRSYSIFVQQSLDFLTEKVGGVKAAENQEASGADVENFVARKAVGNFVELAGLATFHLSPMTLLAVVSDVAYGSQTFLKELAVELKRQGVIPQDSTIDRASDLLTAIKDASGTAAGMFDLPPLSVEGLQETISQTRAAVERIDVATLIPQSELERLWKEMREVADQQQVGLFELSSAMSLFAVRRVGELGGGALSTVRVVGNLFDRHILEHYASSLRTIREQGYYETLSEVAKPYYDAVWHNFSVERPTLTDDLLSGRTIGNAWRGVMGWFGPAGAAKVAPAETTAARAANPMVRRHTEDAWDVTLAPGLAGLSIAVFSIREATVGITLEAERKQLETLQREVLGADAAGGDERRQAIRGLLRRGGFKPSGRSKPAQEYLLGVLRAEEKLPEILNAVDALNTISVVSGLPISMLAFDRVGSHWHLRLGHPDEEFVFNSGGQTIDVGGCIVIEGQTASDQPRSALGSPIKDSATGKIRETDRSFGVCLYGAEEAIDTIELEQWANRLADLMATACQGSRSAIRLLSAD